MGITADTILSAFFKRRDEEPDEVFTTAEAVALLNEAQRELIELKLLITEAEIEWAAGEDEYSLPADFSALATDRAYYGNEAHAWRDYDGPTSEGLFLLPGKVRIYPAPEESTTLRFQYFKNPTDITEDPEDDEYVMDGLVAPSLDKFLINSMLAEAAELDDDQTKVQSYTNKAERAFSKLIIWRNQTYSHQNEWIPDPIVEEHDEYVDNY